MADAASDAPCVGDIEPPRKKLRVRKGTKSCWECKRRKVRCVPSPETNIACGPCERRGAECISQEFPDVVTRRDIGDPDDRLGRVEALVEGLSKKIDVMKNNPSNTEHRAPNLLQPPLSNDPLPEDGRQTMEHKKTAADLLEAWPDKCVLNLILESPLQSSLRELLFKVGSILSPTPEIPDKLSLQDVLRVPESRTYPVLIARKLLFLGLLFQDIPMASARHPKGLAIECRDSISRAVESALNLVTRNGQLVDSIDGIECIMMESMYHDRAGNLRRSWIAARRAMTMGQLMGLHQSTRSKANVDHEYIWSRIVQADRYLSLMLGLPQGSPDNSFATASALGECSPVERLRRLHCVAAGHILQQNSLDGLSSTQEIDDLFQRAASCMPPQWWLTPELTTRAEEEGLKGPEKTFRLMSQAVHYHLLAQLHLPLLLKSSFDQRGTYSKMTAINASREVLTRFLAFRKVNPISSYCHGIDALAFIASTAMCIAHLDAHRQKAQAGMADDTLKFLAHQRQGDRGILEATLKAMEHMFIHGKDVFAGRIGTVLRHLLVIEAEVHAGDLWSYCSNPEGKDEEAGELGCSGKMSDDNTLLKIHIPYLCRVLVRRGSLEEPVFAANLREQPMDAESREELLGHGIFFQEDWGLQDVNSAFFDNLLRGMTDSDFADIG
ncbi:hypothetical protein QBC40DRAFT_340142 [Triangularia verruculosa]|uniref:Zn(2)-C6 fungal-type domain-containing protein n=1 Tax=Triangularia verruculosa TaxID=2587418 RepID=A0AAN6XLI7_9PEZI|nr:hypothetical protein QBC40DRAFT_340142 [Triangularia verruculosa]